MYRVVKRSKKEGAVVRSISRNWRPQVIVLRDLKNLDSMSLGELVATLKVHEQEL